MFTADNTVKVWLEAIMILACTFVFIRCKPFLKFSAKMEAHRIVIHSYPHMTQYF